MNEATERLLWWQTRRFAALLVIVAAIPLLYPPIPPLVDLPGHMGRYRITLALHDSASIACYYGYEWRLIGNLGIDLLVLPLSRLFGLELAVKLIVTCIPPLAVAGMLWIAREVHGRVPPVAFFALALAYCWPFHFGFINFALSMALALNAFGLWLYLARTGRLRLRFALFAVLAWPLWLAHSFGWGFLGLLAFGAETVRRRDAGDPLARAMIGAALVCAPMGLPAIVMLLGHSTDPRARNYGWFNFKLKYYWLQSILRDRWEIFDKASAFILVALAIVAAGWRRMFRLAPMLAVPTAMCLAMFVLLPRIVTGSNYADMRLIPYAVALALLAIAVRPGNRRVASGLAVAGLLFFGIRIGATTISYAAYANSYRSELAALDHVPQGAAVMSLIRRPCKDAWSTDRFEHIPSMVIVRRDGFSNDQWNVDGAQLIRIHYPQARPYDHDPSEIVYPERCSHEGSDFESAIAEFPRAAFDRLWTINYPRGAVTARDLAPLWTNGRSTLYAVLKEKGR